MNVKKLLAQRNLIIYALIGLIFTIVLILVKAPEKEKSVEKKISYAECDHILYANAPITPSDKLNDKNDIHLLHATKNGIAPFASNDEFESKKAELTENNKLVLVESNDYFKIKKLTHSLPYLTPDAAEMVNEIARRFNLKIQEYKVDDYRIMLTSLLRTEETQTKLSHRNRNATKSQSAHLFGTSIDISYKDFYNVTKDTVEQNWEAIQALTKVLVEMRKECKFVGVRERKQSCYHLTVVVCDPGYKEEI